MARPVRKTPVNEVPLSEVKDDLSRYLREAERRSVHDHAAREAGRSPHRLRIGG